MADQPLFDTVQVGDHLPPLEKHPTTRQLVKYAGASGDLYEIHYDLEFARSTGLDGVIIHGALKNAFLAQAVTDWMGVAGKLKQISVQYRGMDVPADTLTIHGEVTEKWSAKGENLVRCALRLENGKGEQTTTGDAVVSLP
jgi:acyl dehydratase